MAADDLEVRERSLKDMKKKFKEQKKSQKKAKKRAKEERKILKKEAKMRKKGRFLDDLTPQEDEEEADIEVVEAEEFEPQPWVRKSTEDVPFIEKKIDMIGDRREKSSLHSLFEERYGESLTTPKTYNVYELTDAEKRRLEAMRASEEEVAPAPEAQPQEVQAKAEEEGTKEAKKKEKKAKVPGEVKSFWYPFQLWLYSKYGKDKMIVLKIFIAIFSILGFIPLLIPRIVVYYIFFTIAKKVKGRKSGEKKPKKEKKAKKKEKATSEA